MVSFSMCDHHSNKPNDPVHISTTIDGRLVELINATSEALNVKTDTSDTQRKLDNALLGSLFASAQMADLQHKYKTSILYVGRLSHS